MLDVLDFLGGATTLESFLKAYKTSATKSFFPYERFGDPEKLNNTQLPPYETFFSKLRNNSPPEKNYSDIQSLIDGGFSSKKALALLKLKQPLASGQKN